MSPLETIAKIIVNEELCKNWELDGETLFLYFSGYEVALLYDNGYLFSIFQIKIQNMEKRQILKKLIHSKSIQVFMNNEKFYIQCQYKRFTNNVIFDQVDLYTHIISYLKLMENEKKILDIYPMKRINVIIEETNQRSNYPLPNNL